MSTQSFASAHSLPSLPRRLAALIAAAIVAIAVGLTVVALNSGTTQPNTITPASRVVVKSITPAGVNTVQSTLNLPHSFAPSGSVSGTGTGAVAPSTPFAGHR